MKNKSNVGKSVKDKAAAEKLPKYPNAPSFTEKDKKAVEFLKKHPIPQKFLK
jgi:hypothetical protein